MYAANTGKDKDKYHDQPKPKTKNDPLESLRHIPAKEGMTWGCCLYGQTWTSAAIKRVASLGRCPGPIQWAKEPTLDCHFLAKAPSTKYRLNRIKTKKYPIPGGKLPKGVNEECPTLIRPHLTETLDS